MKTVTPRDTEIDMEVHVSVTQNPCMTHIMQYCYISACTKLWKLIRLCGHQSCQRPTEMATHERGHPTTDISILLNQHALQ
jgi:hypothetical protein